MEDLLTPYVSDTTAYWISQIPYQGDIARWHIAYQRDMFGDELSDDGALTDEQIVAIDDFVATYP